MNIGKCQEAIIYSNCSICDMTLRTFTASSSHLAHIAQHNLLRKHLPAGPALTPIPPILLSIARARKWFLAPFAPIQKASARLPGSGSMSLIRIMVLEGVLFDRP